jgi:hypothetical protein
MHKQLAPMLENIPIFEVIGCFVVQLRFINYYGSLRSVCEQYGWRKRVQYDFIKLYLLKCEQHI